MEGRGLGLMEPHRLLIVEDEAPVAQMIVAAVRRLGYHVVGVTDSAQQGFALAASARPHLAVLDIELHGRTEGFELAQRLRQELDIPSIFLTGRSDEATLQQVRQSGSFGYLLKPFRPQELKACLELALQRHARESHLARLERAFSAAIRCAADGVILTDPEQRITYLNPAAERLTGWSWEEAIGQPLARVFQQKDAAPESDTAFLRAREMTSDRPAVPPPTEALLLTARNETIPVEVTRAPLRDEVHGLLGTVLVFRDVTERKRYQAALQESRQQLRALARNLETTREDERGRIAREIHDELGQMLTKLKMDLAWLERRLAPTADAGLEGRLRGMTQLLDETVQTVRRIANELRPGMLDTLGLAAALEWEAQQFHSRTGIACRFEAAPGVTAPPDRLAAIALYRIVQEALTNVARHAHATQVHIRLESSGTTLQLTIQDNGQGATPAQLRRPGCLGLLGMHERAHSLGGECRIESQPGRGTRIRVTIPLAPCTPPPRP